MTNRVVTRLVPEAVVELRGEIASDLADYARQKVPKYVFAFAEGDKELKDLLGGKGANLAQHAVRRPSRGGSTTPARNARQRAARPP